MLAPRENDRELKLSFVRRLSTQLAAVVAVVLLLLLVLEATLVGRREVELARDALRMSGRTALPFMAPALRPALDLAVGDDGQVDQDMLQMHVIESAFATAKVHPDFAHAEVVLLGDRVAHRFLGPGVAAEDLKSLYGGGTLMVRREVESPGYLGFQEPIFAPGGKQFLGALRVTFSLARAERQTRDALLVNVGLGLVALFFAFGVIVELSNVVLYRPLARLLGSVAELADGRLGAGVSAERGELGVLANAVQRMSRALAGMVRGIKDTSAFTERAVRAMGASTERMLGSARRQSESAGRVFEAAARVDTSSGAVDDSVQALIRSAESASRATSALSQSLNQLSPRLEEFSNFVRDTDASMKAMAVEASDIASRVATMSETTDRAATTVSTFERGLASIGQNAAAASRLASTVTEQAERCQSATSDAIAGMSGVSASFEAIERAVSGLGQSVVSISQIVGVIEDITSRTKLLSLNASILASQAGEHGSGFAIVAEEIKALSERTALSTREITNLVSALDAERQKTTAAMDEGITRVARGEKLSREVGEAIARILSLTAESRAQIAGIAAATEEQVRGSRTVTDATRRIADMGRQILTSTSTQKSTSATITGLTERMVQSVAGVGETLRREAQSSTLVARSIADILRGAEAVQKESETQRKASKGIVEDIGVIRADVTLVLSDAEAVARDVKELESRSAGLRGSIDKFEV